MRVVARRLVQVLCVAACALLLALAPSAANAQGPRGGGGMMRGGGGPMGGMRPCPPGMGGMGQQQPGTMGGMGQQQPGQMTPNGQQPGQMGPHGQQPAAAGPKDGDAQQAGPPADARINQNDPDAVLAHKSELDLTDAQVQRLEKMAKSGHKRAASLLTKAQKKKLQDLDSVANAAREEWGKKAHGAQGKPAAAPVHLAN